MPQFSSIQTHLIYVYQSSNEPSPADNFQLDSGSSSTENLIESLSNSLALLTQSYKSHLPQTNNQLRTSSNARNKATVQDGRVVVQDVRGRYNANNQGKPFQRNNARGNVVAGNVGGQNRGGIINPGPAKPIKCYNCNGLGHIARECPRPKRLQDSDYFKDKMLLMQAQENGAVLDEEQSLFLAGEQVTNFDEDVDNSPENDLALNVDHVFEADECDAFDSDVDEGPTTQTMFMANLTSEDPIYDEAGPSYDSNTPFEVQDHDTFVDHMDEYHEVHEMQSDVQHNYVVESDADYTSDSNIIPYDQYVEDNEEHVVQSNVSSVRNDALMTILDEMHEQGVQSRLANKPDMVVNDSVTSELARYKELVGEYEKRAKFELTDRERKIDEQMRIIISDRNRKETSLKSELHSAQILLSSTVGHYKSKTEEVTILKKDFKQKEDKFLEEFLDIKRLKEKVEDRLYKQDQSVQTVHISHILCINLRLPTLSVYTNSETQTDLLWEPMSRYLMEAYPSSIEFKSEPIYTEYITMEDEMSFPELRSSHYRPILESPTADSTPCKLPSRIRRGSRGLLPPPSTDITIRARITIRPQASISLPPEAEVDRLLAMTTSSPSPPISLSSPSARERLARCMAPPAHSSPPPMPSPLLPSSGCPTQIQTLKIASTQALIDTATAALPSPPLPPLPPSLYIPPLY
ncbi:retrovirus-related pol polyprotein from transposon TNT 1-94 [Tanacetum coccineum]